MNSKSCYQFELQRLAEPEKAVAKDISKAEILNEFKKRGLIEVSIKDIYSIPEGPCKELANALRSSASINIHADNQKERTLWKNKYDESFKKLDSVKCS